METSLIIVCLISIYRGCNVLGFFVVNMSKISVVVKHGGRKPVKGCRTVENCRVSMFLCH